MVTWTQNGNNGTLPNFVTVGTGARTQVIGPDGQQYRLEQWHRLCKVQLAARLPIRTLKEIFAKRLVATCILALVVRFQLQALVILNLFILPVVVKKESGSSDVVLLVLKYSKTKAMNWMVNITALLMKDTSCLVFKLRLFSRCSYTDWIDGRVKNKQPKAAV